MKLTNFLLLNLTRLRRLCQIHTCPWQVLYLFFTFLLLTFTFLSCAHAAPRYISLAPSTTEILFALGLDDEIVGISSYCNYPPQAKLKPKVGDFSHPSLETIIALKPDYIFCTGLEQTPAIAALKKHRLKVYVADPKNIKELFDSISDIGALTGKQERAAGLIGSLKEQIADIQERASNIPQDKRKKVFVEIWHDPLTTAGDGSLIDEMISLAGGINIAHRTKRPFSIYSAEDVITQDPDYIILAYMVADPASADICERFGWNNITAVKTKQIINDIDPDILLRPSPRVAEGIREIHKRLYP